MNVVKSMAIANEEIREAEGKIETASHMADCELELQLMDGVKLLHDAVNSIIIARMHIIQIGLEDDYREEIENLEEEAEEVYNQLINQFSEVRE